MKAISLKPMLSADVAGGRTIGKRGRSKPDGIKCMDNMDKKILALLQEDSAQPIADIARKVGLSVTPCWRRIQKLEEVGVIRARVALLDGGKIGFGMSVFVAIKTDQHNADWLAEFATRISAQKEVVEFYRMSGEVDYLLRVVVPDMAAYDQFYKKLISEVDLTDVSSSFAMEEIKYTTALPLREEPPSLSADPNGQPDERG